MRMNNYSTATILLLIAAILLPTAVVMGQEREEYHTLLQPIEIIGKRKLDKIGRRGIRIPLAAMSFEAQSERKILGSIIECDKEFEVHEFCMKVLACTADSATFRFTLSRVESDSILIDETPHTTYFTMLRSSKREEFRLMPSDKIRLEPGKYFIGIELISISDTNSKILFPLYRKKSFVIYRDGEPESISYNIGLYAAGIRHK